MSEIYAVGEAVQAITESLSSAQGDLLAVAGVGLGIGVAVFVFTKGWKLVKRFI